MCAPVAIIAQGSRKQLCARFSTSCSSFTMSTVSVSERVVVQYATSARPVVHWAPPLDRVQDIGGVKFVTLTYSGDRGFAQFCGGDAATNPLKAFTWLESAIQLRNDAVGKVLDKIATDQVYGHVSGKAVKCRRQFHDALPKTIQIHLPPLSFDGAEVGERTVSVVTETNRTKALSIECDADVMQYVRLAMTASRTDTPSRPRAKHKDRITAVTGVNGVFKTHGHSRVGVMRTDEEGKRSVTSLKRPGHDHDPDGEITANICKRLKATAEVKAEDGVKEEDDGAGCAENMGTEDEAEEEEEADDDKAIAEAELDEARHHDRWSKTQDASAAPPDDAASDDEPVASACSAAVATSMRLNPKWNSIFGHLEHHRK